MDVCKVLDLENVTKALIELDEDEKIDLTGSKVGNKTSKLRFVSESGLYSLVFKSRKPEAKKFRKWVTSEVLPAIRKTGTYSTRPSIPSPNPSSAYQHLYKEWGQTPKVEEYSGQLVVDSRVVADYFGVEPHNIHQIIKCLDCSEKFKADHFTFYRQQVASNGTGRKPHVETEHYLITRDGFMLMVMSFPKAWNMAWCKEAFVDAFRNMEAKLHGPLRHESVQKIIAGMWPSVTRLSDCLAKSGHGLGLIEKIRRYRHLGLNLTETGKLTGISRQRVRDYEAGAIACGIIRPYIPKDTGRPSGFKQINAPEVSK